MAIYKKLDLDRDEHVILEVRRHWFVFALSALGPIFAAIAPYVIYIAVARFAPDLLSMVNISANESAMVLFFYTLWIGVLWVIFFVDWTKYYLDVWYVTEKRIIAIDQRSIFDREVSNLRFDKIQDVTLDVQGFIPTLLRFGNIKVQTAGEDNKDFIMKFVRYPEEVRRVIFNQHNEIGDKDNSRL